MLSSGAHIFIYDAILGMNLDSRWAMRARRLEERSPGNRLVYLLF